MNADELRAAKVPPKEKPLTALWHAAKGEWDKAHAAIQNDVSKEAAWIHAHAHRAQGDKKRAAEWYDRAGRPHGKGTFSEEWNEIAGVLLALHS